VLALNGLGKVLRSNLASILAMAGFAEKWDELMTICTKALTSGRKAVAVAAAQLVTGVLQVSWWKGDLWQALAELRGEEGDMTWPCLWQCYHTLDPLDPQPGSVHASRMQANPLPSAILLVQVQACSTNSHHLFAVSVPQVIKRNDQPEAQFAWKRCISTVDTAIGVMARPGCPVPLQARSELLTGLAAAYAAQKQGGFDLEDTEALLRWCAGLARCPLGVDDVTPVPGVLPPVQKLVLQLLGHLSLVSRPGLGECVWQGEEPLILGNRMCQACGCR
jgi:hypothetical protein